MDGIDEKTKDGKEPTQEKTVSYDDYQKILEENSKLKEREREISK